MYDAYTVLSVAEKLPVVINCLASSNGTLLAGTKSGYLLRYSSRSGDSVGAQYDLQVCKTFSKKSVLQLKVLSKSGLLLSLTDGVVEVHDLDQANFPLVSVVPRSKNVSCFSAYEYDTADKPSKEATGAGVLLAVAVRRKCQLYVLNGHEFSDYTVLNEVVFNDSIRCISLVQSSFIAAVRDEYFHINLTSDEELGDPGSVQSLFTIGAYGQADESLVLALPDRQIFACRRDNLTHFVHYNGQLAIYNGYENIQWSEVPGLMEYDGIYLIALLSKVMEIRSVKPSQLVQVVEMPKLKLIVRSYFGRLFLACSSTSSHSDLYLLDSNFSAVENVQRLVKDKEYELAIQIAERFQGSTDPKKRVRDIKLLYAFHLFTKRRFQEAFDVYSEIKADVLYVIGLFPDLLPDQVRQTITYPGPVPSDLPKQDMQRALLALTSFLSEMRTNIASRLYQYKKSGHIRSNEPLMLSCKEEVMQMKNFLEIVDTTLLKCYLMNNDMLVASLLRLPDNSCNVAESEIILRKHKKMSELFLLYERKEMHGSALKLLQEEATEAGSASSEILHKAVNYLQDLGPEHFDLILEYAKWIQREKPELVLKIFTEDCEPARRLNKLKVLEFIQKESPENVVPYLEHIIYQWHEDNEKFHVLLGEMYIKEIKELYAAYGPDQPGSPFPVGLEKPTPMLEAEEKLLNLLRTSVNYNAEALLVQLPFYFLHEARATIFGKLKRHEQVLAIYTNLLQDFQSAKDYCSEYYNDQDSQASQLYLKLFQFYMSPPSNSILGIPYAMLPSPGRRLDYALQILVEFGKNMDLVQALDALSSNVPLKQLSIPLQKIILDTLDVSWESNLRLSLTQVLYVKSQKSRMQWQGESVLINYASQCSSCKKRIENSAFVRFTDGSLVHYYCFKKESPYP